MNKILVWSVIFWTWQICSPRFARAALKAETHISAKTTYVLCEHRSLVRTLRIVKLSVPKDGRERCQTVYNKAGTDRLVGHAHHLRSCLGFLKNIRHNLEQAHWKCRDVSSATVSVSTSLSTN